MKKRTVLTPIYGAIDRLENAVILAARSEEISPRQRERISFVLRLTGDLVADLKHRDK